MLILFTHVHSPTIQQESNNERGEGLEEGRGEGSGLGREEENEEER